MKHLSVMIKPASSLCNMRCSYCFYADVSNMRDVPSYGMMSEETAEKIIANVYKNLADGDSITFAFQGGEPTLAGLGFFQNFVEQVAEQTVKARVLWALQTNGTMLDDEWCTFLKSNQFLVGLSLDGNSAMHNQNRLDSKGKGNFSQVLAAKHLMDKYRVEYNILCVLTNETARHPQKVWKFIIENGIRYIQFIPCLDDLGSSANTPWALTPKRFFSFFSSLFPLWQEQLLANNYISVKLFDDIINLFVRGQVTSCGIHGQCQAQYIIEADGSVYPCDFYVLDKYCLGNMRDITLEDAFERTKANGFLKDRAPLPAACSGCEFHRACHGGCKRMAKAMYVDETGFCGYRELLNKYGTKLVQIGKRFG
ncbi:MAG: SPASM domain-containing protein [Oscillospiraceae bacterium]